jgi:hypothetical protein
LNELLSKAIAKQQKGGKPQGKGGVQKPQQQQNKGKPQQQQKQKPAPVVAVAKPNNQALSKKNGAKAAPVVPQKGNKKAPQKVVAKEESEEDEDDDEDDEDDEDDDEDDEDDGIYFKLKFSIEHIFNSTLFKKRWMMMKKMMMKMMMMKTMTKMVIYDFDLFIRFHSFYEKINKIFYCIFNSFN